MIKVRDSLPDWCSRASLRFRRRLYWDAYKECYELKDLATALWFARFDCPTELDAAADMVRLRYNVKEIP